MEALTSLRDSLLCLLTQFAYLQALRDITVISKKQRVKSIYNGVRNTGTGENSIHFSVHACLMSNVSNDPSLSCIVILFVPLLFSQ
jgi:hypothetical protein